MNIQRIEGQLLFTAGTELGVSLWRNLLLVMEMNCSAGVGRTGTFIVIDTMLERIEDGEPIDIYKYVASLMTKRRDMVQTEVCVHELRKFELGS